MVYSGWEPHHPALSSETYDPQVGESVFFEGAVVWNIFLWTLQKVSARVPVVADTPFNHDWNRSMFEETAQTICVPIIEVALGGMGDVLLQRVRVRAASGEVHVKAKFSVNPARYTQPYHPVLPEDRAITVIPTLNRTGGDYERIRELNNTLAAEKCCNLNL